MTEPVDVESAAAKVQHMTRSLLDADVRAGAGATLAEKLRGLVSAHAQSVLVFIKPSCPFCTEVLCTFAALRVPVVTVELHDRDAKAALREVSSHATFPNVYIKGAHVGGCDTVKALQAKGELDALIGDLALDDDAAHTLAGIKPPARPRGVATHPLAWYPNTVNRWTVQGTGLLVVALCILGIIFREERWGWWLTAYLLLDFTCRFLAGGTASLLTQLAALAVSPFERGTLLRPQFKPGPPKQFAASVGVLFTTAATALYFNGQYAAGAAVLGALAGAAALEGFFDFCLGCVFFGFAVQLRIVPDYVYRIASNTLQETKTTWEYTQLPSGAPAPVRKEPADAGADAAPVALRYKVKSAEWTKDDFHVVRNMQVQYFAMPMGIAGLGVAFKMASRWTANWAVATLEAAGVTGASLPVVFYAQPRWWHTFGIAGAIVYCILMLLFLARVALFPRKVAKEWSCPWRGNAFALISANMLLFAFLVYDLHPRAAAAQRFARALWWTGAATNMCMTVAKMGEWISRALSKEVRLRCRSCLHDTS
jgi:glutaredoxin-related protein